MRAQSFHWVDDHRLTVVKISIVLIAMATALLALRPDRYVVDAPTIEDAYYPLSVARNVAMGKGVTIDGINPTNGFQPLFTFLSVPAFMLAGADRYLAIRYVIVLEWLFYISTAFLIGLIGRDLLRIEETNNRSLMFWLTLFVYTASLFVFAQHFNGLETGFLLFCICLAWRYYQVAQLEKWSSLLILGVILGLVVLARIDTVFLVAALSFYQFLSNRKFGIVFALSRAAVVAGAAFVISAPWWLYNLLQFGSLMPSSGRAQELWGFSLHRLGAALSAILQTWIPFIYASRLDGIPIVLIRIIFVVLLVVFWVRARDEFRSVLDVNRNVRLRRAIEFAECLAASIFILVAWYALSSVAMHFYARYFAPAALLSTIVISYTLQHVKVRPAIPFISVAFSLVLLLAVLTASTGLITSFRGNTNYTDQLQLVNQYVPAGEKVASGQTGTLGYFRDRVVNLDGKVNAEALQFRENMWQYLRQNEIQWFCDWPANARFFLGENPEDHGWKLVAERGQHALYHFEEVTHR